MSYSETFTRKCSTSGPSYTYYVNNCNVTSHYDYSNQYSNTYYYSNYNNQYKNSYSYENYKDDCMDYSYCSDSDSCTDSCTDYTSHRESYGGTCGVCADYESYYDSYKNSYSHSESSHYSDSSSCSTCTVCSDYYYGAGGSTCSNYSYCSTVSYKNSNNRCQVQWTYTNYADAYNTKTGGPLSLSWDSSWNALAKYKKITPEVIGNLKSNITKLCTSKGRNRVSNPEASFSTNEKITSEGVENLRVTLESLYSDLKQSSAGSSSISTNNPIEGDPLTKLKTLTSSLAQADITYVNYLNSSYANSTQGTTPNTSYINSVEGSTPAATYTNYSDIRYS